ncbi:Conserved_hypothetical protein [Hexamita inflata]|uniref:Uncharacterized protein n=1 Tax=Hexamita inflata TaxID=28002 RepID=A0AA86UVL4_9EUKA|nr:Conserved hypothetical protein [Hexamita inflata]
MLKLDKKPTITLKKSTGYVPSKPKYESKLNEQEIEMLLEQRKAQQEAVQNAQISTCARVYNRREDAPKVKIGNWVEDQILMETRKQYGVAAEKDVGAASCTRDFRIDNRTLYVTENREYGIKGEKQQEFFADTLSSDAFKNRPISEIETKYKEDKLINQHEHHNILNVNENTQRDFHSTTGASFRQSKHDETIQPLDFKRSVKIHQVSLQK